MHWLALILAACFEILWFYCVSYLNRFSWNSFVSLSFLKGNLVEYYLLAIGGYVVFGILNMLCFSKAIQKIPPAIAFSVWTGLALAGLQIGDALWISAINNPLKLVCIVAILIGVIGLKFATAKEETKPS